jgi:hypothetical protein
VQNNFQYELGSSQTYIQYGYWDSLKKGLLAGEKLLFDLKRMEMAYYEQNKRGFEISKNISLAQLDPLALVQLRQNGECYIELPETIFDLDYPGHYMRRIKSVSLTIPCIAGPYNGLNCTLTLLENKYRKDNSSSGDYAEAENDTRFMYNQAAIQSIATSSGRNDSGLFQLNFEDERYLPFEGAGAISKWKVQLPNTFRNFDYNSISDVVIHLNYNAKDGGETLKTTVANDLKDLVINIALGSGNAGLTRMFSLKHEYSGDWYRFLNPPATQTGQNISIQNDSEKFPYVFHDYTIKITDVDLCVVVNPSSIKSTTTLKVKLTYPSGSSSEVTAINDGTLEGMLFVTIPSLTEDTGEWKIEISEDAIPSELETDSDGHKRLNSELVTDIILICRYSIS